MVVLFFREYIIINYLHAKIKKKLRNIVFGELFLHKEYEVNPNSKFVNF